MENASFVQNVDPMAKFKPVQLENSITDLLQELFTLNNIEAKARIRRPSALAGLRVFGDDCIDIGMEKTGATIILAIRYRMEYSISEDGKGRGEFVDAFKSANQMSNPELSIAERLTTDLKDKM